MENIIPKSSVENIVPKFLNDAYLNYLKEAKSAIINNAIPTGIRITKTQDIVYVYNDLVEARLKDIDITITDYINANYPNLIPIEAQK